MLVTCQILSHQEQLQLLLQDNPSLPAHQIAAAAVSTAGFLLQPTQQQRHQELKEQG